MGTDLFGGNPIERAPKRVNLSAHAAYQPKKTDSKSRICTPKPYIKEVSIMFNKAFSIHLVLFGLLFSQMTSACFADAAAQDEQAPELQVIPRKHEEAGKYKKEVRNIYNKPATQPPSASSQSGRVWIHAPKMHIKPLVRFQKDVATPAVSERFIADAPRRGGKLIPPSDIARRRYKVTNKQNNAKNLYRRIMQQDPDGSQTDWVHVSLSKKNVENFINSPNDIAVRTAIEELSADFSNRRRSPKLLYRIARIYEKSERYEQAKSIYQQIVQQYPDSFQASEAQSRISLINALSLNESGKKNAPRCGTNSKQIKSEDNYRKKRK